jgi:site-specific recombinase XerC
MHGLTLERLSPIVVAAYVEEIGTVLDAPSVKQHLAAIRMLFDYLVIGQVVPVNPAAAVRGPKHVVKRGKTPVLAPDQARTLLDSIDVTTIAVLRDRAIIGAMVFSFARVSALIGMNVEDYYPDAKRWWIRLHEKGSKFHEVPAYHNAEEYLDEYLAAAGIGDDRKTPLFRSLNRRRELTERQLSRREALAMIKRRVRDSPIGSAATHFGRRASPPTSSMAAPWNTPSGSRRTSRHGRQSCTIGRVMKSRSTRLSGFQCSQSSICRFIGDNRTEDAAQI